jgi:hypothetical protein
MAHAPGCIAPAARAEEGKWTRQQLALEYVQKAGNIVQDLGLMKLDRADPGN